MKTENRRVLYLMVLTTVLIGAYVSVNGIASFERATDLNIDLSLNSIHLTVKQFRDGALIMESHHPATITTIGLDWVEDQLGDTPSVNASKWISLSNSTDAPSDAWTEIPDELTIWNLTRALGVYASTGVGAWTIIYTFTATGTVGGVILSGLQWAEIGDGNLLCADTFTVANMEADDTLELTWSASVS